ncbi:MAG: CdaR family protein [Spirochaetaceae bacterium]
MRITRILHNWHVKVLCLIIAMLLVFFTRANALKEEPVVVFLEAITNNNYTFTNPLPERVTLILKGEESEIQKVPISDIIAYIDASDIVEDGTYQLPILIRQEKVFGQTQNVEITVSPIFITAVIEQKMTKYLRVESIITGIPAHGYEISSRFVHPKVISVTGPKSHLQDLETIQTEPVDVTGKDTDFTTRVKLSRSDSRLSFPEGEFVDFQGIITETSSIKILENVNIAIKELSASLEVTSELPQVSVNVEGKLLSLQNFTKSNISLTLYLSDITAPGIYDVPLTYWTPKYAHVYDKSVDIVTIVVKRKTGASN